MRPERDADELTELLTRCLSGRQQLDHAPRPVTVNAAAIGVIISVLATAAGVIFSYATLAAATTVNKESLQRIETRIDRIERDFYPPHK